MDTKSNTKKGALSHKERENMKHVLVVKEEKTFNLIGNAQKRAQNIQQIVENFKQVADENKSDYLDLMESATQLLAGVKNIMSTGGKLATSGLSPASLAGVVAGIRVLSRALPKITDPQKKIRALNVLSGLKIGKGMSLQSVTAIANLADKDPELEQLRQAFNDYAETGKPNSELLKVFGQLQIEVDQAIRAAQQAPQPQSNPQRTPTPNNVTGGMSTGGQVAG